VGLIRGKGRSSWRPVEAVTEGALDVLETRLSLWIPDNTRRTRDKERVF